MLDRLKTSSKYVYRAAHPAVKRCSQDNAAPMKKPRASLSPLTAPRHEGLRHSSVSPLQKKKKKNQKKKIQKSLAESPELLAGYLACFSRAAVRRHEAAPHKAAPPGLQRGWCAGSSPRGFSWQQHGLLGDRITEMGETFPNWQPLECKSGLKETPLADNRNFPRWNEKWIQRFVMQGIMRDATLRNHSKLCNKSG